MQQVQLRVFIALIFLALFAASCGPKDDEEALISLVQKAAEAAEKHAIGDILDLTAKDFKAMPGNLDRQGIKQTLFMAFRYYGELKVLYPKPKVDLAAEAGPSVSLPFVIVRKNQELPDLKELYHDPKKWLEKIGENADLYRLKLQTVKQDGEWVVKQAELERFTGRSFE